MSDEYLQGTRALSHSTQRSQQGRKKYVNSFKEDKITI